MRTDEVRRGATPTNPDTRAVDSGLEIVGIR
jgi:hypothetical protein